MLCNLPCTYREEAIEILAQLAVQVNAMKWIVSCSAYLSSKVPLVKLEIDPYIGFLETKVRDGYFINSLIDPMLYNLELKEKR